MKKINLKSLPNYDLLIARFPCQSFSVIGRQQGTTDPRGQIIYYLMNMIEESKPKVFILENVLMISLQLESYKPPPNSAVRLY